MVNVEEDYQVCVRMMAREKEGQARGSSGKHGTRVSNIVTCVESSGWHGNITLGLEGTLALKFATMYACLDRVGCFRDV